MVCLYDNRSPETAQQSSFPYLSPFLHPILSRIKVLKLPGQIGCSDCQQNCRNNLPAKCPVMPPATILTLLITVPNPIILIPFVYRFKLYFFWFHTRIVTFSGLFFTDFLQISRILPYKIIYYFSASGQLPNVHNMLHNKAYDRDATPAGSTYQNRFAACFDELDHITV